MRILVVEDEKDLASALARGLRQSRYAVDIALTCDDAELKLISAAYDVVVMDWNLPDGSGMVLSAQLRDGTIQTWGDRRPKVLMLTARDDVSDRVAGLDAGADDYLVKPFDFAELSARVRALLRRDDEGGTISTWHDLELDPLRFRATRRGEDLNLSVKEFSLLEYFLRHPGEVMGQEVLLEHVWDELADPFTNTVRMTISHLRRKLGDPPLIKTIAGRGYVLQAPEDQE